MNRARAAHIVVKKAIENGAKVPVQCTMCRKKCRPVAHHDNYFEPTVVRWLCRSCHSKWHAKHGHATGWQAPEPKQKTQGHRILSEWLEREGCGAAKKLAVKMGISKQSMSQIKNGNRPTLDGVIALEELLGIDLEEWLTPWAP